MPPRLILFGAFDRHNFGDLLLAHCAEAKHPGRDPVFAGLAARDLRPWGGHAVRALAEVVAACGHEPAELVHVGGEVLTTTAWEAAVMLQTPDEARRVIARLGRDSAGQRAWAAQYLGTRRQLPYLLGAADVPAHWTVRFAGVGGVALDGLPAALRGEALRALRGAAVVCVRDRVTAGALERCGVQVCLVPDPAVETPRLFGVQIGERAAGAAFATLRKRQPRWLALQLAAAWGDDATLARVARAAAAEARARQAGIVLFCAGRAPWHDDPEVLQRMAAHVAGIAPDLSVEILPSDHVFDLCALLAHACAYLGTSLHGWIVAASFGVPARCLVDGPGAKAAAYIETWREAAGGGWLARDDLPPCMDA